MSTAAQSGEDLFRQAMHAWESALESGTKMQDEYAKWLRQMFSNSNTLAEWYERMQSTASETLLKTQEGIDEAIALFNQQMESSLKLMQNALRARQGGGDADARAGFLEAWENAVEAMRMNTQAMLKMNSRFIGTWSELMRKANGQAADTMQELARKTSEQAEKIAASVSERVREMAKQAS